MPIIAGRASAAYGAGFGKLLGGGAFSPVSAFDALSTTVVPSGGLSSIQFAGIPNNYSHLQLRCFVQTNRTIYGRSGINVTFNNDVAGNYSYHYLMALEEGSSAATSASASQTEIRLDLTGTSVSDDWGMFIIDILDYSSPTKNKTLRALTGVSLNALTSGAGGGASFHSGLWRDTTPINSIKFLPASGESLILQYSHFALYGVK